MTPRTVLVTGATGLLGREVAKTFELGGWSVKGTGYSRADGVDVLKVDLRSEEELAKALDENRSVPCDAAETILLTDVDRGFQDPRSLFTVSGSLAIPPWKPADEARC